MLELIFVSCYVKLFNPSAHITSKDMLKQVMAEEWNKISVEDTTKLVQSMPNRLAEVLKRKGYPTSY